jgi:EAL domain-containing protein (putative c-di-GMP-specific phosphodiesterase class I)
VSGIIDLVSSLGFRVIAEGIGSANQLKELKKRGLQTRPGLILRPLASRQRYPATREIRLSQATRLENGS